MTYMKVLNNVIYTSLIYTPVTTHFISLDNRIQASTLWTLSSSLTISLNLVTPSPSLPINPSLVYGSPKNRTLSTTMVPFGARSPKSQIICNMVTRFYNCLNNTEATGMKLVIFWDHLFRFEFI